MPLLFPIEKLHPEMHLAGDVMNGVSLLLPVEWQLTAEDIDFLQAHSPDKYIPIAAPMLDNIVRFADNKSDKNISHEVRKMAFEAFGELSDKLCSGSTLTDEETLHLRQIIAKMLTRIQYNQIDTAVITHDSNNTNYLAVHTANVFYLSVLMGSKLTGYIKNERRRGSSAKRLYNPGSLGPLAAGAFYHDVGLISAEPWCPGGPKPSVTEQTWLDAHTVRGDEMLKGKISSIARMVIRQHHENSDGSGYPKKVAGDKINVYARIVRVADAYCSATAPQACLKNSSAPSVLYEMLYGEQRKCYDEEVLQVLARVIQPFPNGAQLKLQTGKTAVVVGHNRRDPFKPKVVIVFDEQGRLTPEKSLKTSFFLSDRHDHQIASCGAEDLAFISEGLFSVKSGNGIDFKEQLVSANISHNTHTGKIG